MKVVRLSTSRTGHLYHQECSWYLFSLGAESTPGPWYGRKEYVTEKSSATTGNRSWDLLLVAQRLNHYATPGPPVSLGYDLLLWSTIMIYCYDLLLWSTVIIYYYDLLLWSTVMIYCYDLLLWSTAMIYCYDLLLWSTAMIYCYNLLLWTTVMIYCYDLLLWSTVMICCYDLLAWSAVMIYCYDLLAWSAVMIYCYDLLLWSTVLIYCYDPIEFWVTPVLPQTSAVSNLHIPYLSSPQDTKSRIPYTVYRSSVASIFWRTIS
jgi:hypothetical protein